MPGRRRAPVKRPRAQKTARRAIHYVQALYLMGYGLISHYEAGGDAIVALAEETGQRLEAVKKIWNEMLGGGDGDLAARSTDERRS
jgi:hypothetical protein